MTESVPHRKVIRYIVVVHGIGKQRKNETALSIVSRFAEARRPLARHIPRDVLTLGMASSETGASRSPVSSSSAWMEFRGIPSTKLPCSDPEILRPFLGEHARTDGNLRFVDVCWSDLMQDDYPQVGQAIGPWADGLIGRMERRHEYAHRMSCPEGYVPAWILENLRTLRSTARALHLYMGLRGIAARDVLFDEYMGDIQLYGEYAQTRGRAVLRFHRLMDQVETQHRALNPQCEARYVVVAHSLGTVMSMDALLYAHTSTEMRMGRAPSMPNLPFAGYLDTVIEGLPETEDRCVFRPDGRPANPDFVDPQKMAERHWADLEEALPSVEWVDRVDSLVTMGSPIDKYLVIWWLNYRYLLSPELWIERTRTRRIQHYNYCEEQDPVGHELDVARTAPAFAQIFEPQRDLVYNRDAVPLAAHMSYLKDQELQRLVMHQTVDCPSENPGINPCDECRKLEPDWFKIGVYRRVQWISYLAIPLIVLLLDFAAFLAAYYSENPTAIIGASVFFVGVCWVGRNLLDLSIWWRQIQVTKSKAQWNIEGKAASSRRRWRRLSRAGLWFRHLGCLVAGGLLFGLCRSEEILDVSQLVLVLGTALATLLVGFFLLDLSPGRRAIPWGSLLRVDLPLFVMCVAALVGGARVMGTRQTPGPARDVAYGVAGFVTLNPHFGGGNDRLETLRTACADGSPAQDAASGRPCDLLHHEERSRRLLFGAGAFLVMGAVVFGYANLKYMQVRRTLKRGDVPPINFPDYVNAAEPSGGYRK